MSMVPTEPGDYVVTTGFDHETGEPREHAFDGVTFSYGEDGSLRVMRGMAMVATFRWWESIVEKGA